ncbi:MAG: hypothetical protein KY457_01070, partial [Actinobacteria bacterium]|nr:hypothetical protein [Actinomycetota bacterium]
MRSKFLRSMTVGATAVGVLLLPTAAFAQAADPPGRAQQPQSPGQSGDAASGAQDGDGFTEDNDTNDGDTRNNVADDGDNAHPSGKDRSVEHGRSGNQGKAQSDPDDDGRGPDRSNGGADQADGPGGVDKADQDGNNGCGNDDDFEDDNEGLCGGPTAASDAPGDDGQDEEQDRRQGRSEEDRRQARNDQRQDDQRRQQEPKDDQRRQQEPKDEQRRQQEPKDDRRQDADRASADQAVAEIDVVFSCTEVSVTSTKDLSNVVLVFEDGSTQKLDGLSGQKGTFSGTGQNAGKTITTVYVKSGSNASGEGPGYGERFDSDATACAEGSPGPEGPTGTDDGTDGDGTTGTDGDGTTGTDGDGTTGT